MFRKSVNNLRNHCIVCRPHITIFCAGRVPAERDTNQPITDLAGTISVDVIFDFGCGPFTSTVVVADGPPC